MWGQILDWQVGGAREGGRPCSVCTDPPIIIHSYSSTHRKRRSDSRDARQAEHIDAQNLWWKEFCWRQAVRKHLQFLKWEQAAASTVKHARTRSKTCSEFWFLKKISKLFIKNKKALLLSVEVQLFQELSGRVKRIKIWHRGKKREIKPKSKKKLWFLSHYNNFLLFNLDWLPLSCGSLSC